MNRIVIKFGGTSVMDLDRIRNAAKIVLTEVLHGNQVVVVVSAMGHTTDHLIDMAKELQHKPNARELDYLMVTGEQVSCALLTMAIQSLGGKALSFDGGAAGILTDSTFGSAEIKQINPQTLLSYLNDNCIPVVPGFQGRDAFGQWTTLGRGGSDTTAIALAAAVSAQRCDIYTDVTGVFSADPNLFEHAYKLDSIAYSEMLELAKNGAQVLNARSVDIAMRNNVAVRVRSTFHPADLGTLVTASTTSQLNWFTGVAVMKEQALIKIQMTAKGLCGTVKKRAYRQARFKIKAQLLSLLRKSGLAFEQCRSLSASAQELSVCLSEHDVESALESLKPECEYLGFEDIRVEGGLNKVSLIARDITSQREVDSIRALAQDGISIRGVSGSPRRISFLVSKELHAAAVERLHTNLCKLQLAC
ncbi:MAG TPA: aspartate kinase [Oculatellaceae cyanobacterium]